MIMEGKAVYACSLLAIEADNKKILTIEGLVREENFTRFRKPFSNMTGCSVGFAPPA